jgi:hypothetical protein
VPPELGRVPSPPDPRDFSIRSLVPAIETIPIPRSFRNRTLARSLTRRLDQQGSSCVGHGHALLKMVQERRDMRRQFEFDPYWIWQRAKERDGIGDPAADRGTYPRTAFDVLLKLGAKVGGQQAIDPSIDFETRFRIASYYRLNSVDEVKAALFLFGPVIFGSDWFDSWMAFPGPKDGKLPAPDDVAGGHEYVGYGFDDRIVLPWTGGTTTGGFICANSWSNAFAKNGDFWLPYAAFDETNDFEAWKSLDVTTGKV